MSITVKQLTEKELPFATEIWNSVVRAGNAFPQTEELEIDDARDFFASQTYTAAAVDESGEVVGVYILHPNNVGRCGHICNASYAVKSDRRGEHIGEALVSDCLKKAMECGFKVLQFNAVVKSNTAALALYKKLGFVQLGIIPEGFRLDDGTFEDIVVHYITL